MAAVSADGVVLSPTIQGHRPTHTDGGVDAAADGVVEAADMVVLSPTIHGYSPTRKNSPHHQNGAAPLLPEEGWPEAGVVGAADGVVVPQNSQFSTLHPALIDPVHVYRLTRSTSAPSLFTVHSSLFTERGAFPGFEFLGIAAEEQHVKDYAAEVLKFQNLIERAVAKEERRRKLSAKESLAQGIIDGSYARYLLNE